MPLTRETRLARQDMETRLQDAIAHWRPDRPRRWLAKHGYLMVEGRYPLAEQYRLLRAEAEGLLRRPRPTSASGLPSHVLHLG